MFPVITGGSCTGKELIFCWFAIKALSSLCFSCRLINSLMALNSPKSRLSSVLSVTFGDSCVTDRLVFGEPFGINDGTQGSSFDGLTSSPWFSFSLSSVIDFRSLIDLLSSSKILFIVSSSAVANEVSFINWILLISRSCSRNFISTSSLAFLVAALTLFEWTEFAEDREDPVLSEFREVLEKPDTTDLGFELLSTFSTAYIRSANLILHSKHSLSRRSKYWYEASFSSSLLSRYCNSWWATLNSSLIWSSVSLLRWSVPHDVLLELINSFIFSISCRSLVLDAFTLESRISLWYCLPFSVGFPSRVSLI